MVKPRTLFRSFAPVAALRIFSFLFAFLIFVSASRAAIQFDVFLGYDDVVPEASWFPVICEIKNDGPSFTGVIEISAGHFNESQVRRTVVELPTGTLKRVVIPVFSAARYQSSWNIRLLDDRGNLHAEQPDKRPRRQTAAGTSVIGAIPRTPTGVPNLRPPRVTDSELQPTAARLLTSLVPDNPLALEGLDTIYLNSEKATELTEPQISALLAWLHLGGHLIVAVEQIGDVNAVPWLRQLIPCDLTGISTIQAHGELQRWLHDGASSGSRAPPQKIRVAGKNVPTDFNPYADANEDAAFEKSDLQVVTGTVRNATTLVSVSGTPLILVSQQGRGRVTALLFSPERKPFTTWNNLPSFWSKITEISPELYLTDNSAKPNAPNLYGGWSVDGVFGAMIDSKQVRKLPVEWLLLLLIVYLVVIGPLDQYWLKRIKRPMLTWITFPCYVVLFSLLIYFIGYKLRAGETEWNELHVVDVLANGDGAELRGRSYASVYSPVNASYRVAAQQHFSTFRGEFQSSFMGGGQDNERATILQAGDNFRADIFVPVWTSQLYASDWWQSGELPISLSVTTSGGDSTVVVKNLRPHDLTDARIAIGDRIMELGALPAGQTRTIHFVAGQGTRLRDYVLGVAGNFQAAATSRQRAFGSSGGGHLADLPNDAMAISFLSEMAAERFILPPGLDVSPLLGHGGAVLLAWEADYSPIQPLNQFAARRSQKNTLWRVSVPVNAASAP